MGAALCRYALLLLLGVTGLFSPVQASGPRNVLILNSYHQGMDWTDGEVSGIREALNPRDAPQIHIEYMDSKRLAD